MATVEFNLAEADKHEWPWPHFSPKEMACKCGCGQVKVVDAFMDKLERLRADVGFALPVTSGYRCPKHNMSVSGTGPLGPHTFGRAADLGVDRAKAFAVIAAAPGLGFTGIGLQQKGAGRYVHVDDLMNLDTNPRPALWSY